MLVTQGLLVWISHHKGHKGIKVKGVFRITPNCVASHTMPDEIFKKTINRFFLCDLGG
jgi:hypothetical protein